jgi:DHA2 family multidrug resistance protein
VLRALQGFSGGVLIPLAFTIIVAMLPPSKRPLGLAGFAVTATFAPAIGPTIGGWLTDNYGWQTIFYINLVPGTVMLGALIYGLPRSAMRFELLRHGDWLGIALMAVGLASLQTVLDEGNVYDWFGSPFIVRLSLLAFVMLSAFIAVELMSKEPLVQLRLLARRNFGFGTLGNFLVGFALYASAYLLPQYLSVSQGFDAQQTGEVMAWTGLPQLVIIPFVPLLMRYIDLHLDTNYAAPQLFWPDVTRALGQAIVMTPLSAIAVVGILPAEAGSASGLFNMLRNLGGAIGTAALETFFTKREQYHSFIINSHVSALQPATQQRMAQLQQFFMTHGTPDPSSAMHRATIAIGNSIRAEATFMGYADCFALLGVVLLCAILAVAMLKKGTTAAGAAH